MDARESPLSRLLAAAACLAALVSAASAAATAAVAAAEQPKLNTAPALSLAAQQLDMMTKVFPAGSGKFPSTTLPDGSWDVVENTGWVSGFFTGCLWKMHALTGDSKWAKTAVAMLPSLEPVKSYTGTHDVGFIIMSSFGDALEAVPAVPSSDARKYRKVLLKTAESLAKRYNSKLGLFRSWGADLKDKEFKVIIDNMMNLELMLVASKLKDGKQEWRDMAVSHAKRTAKDFFREDGSTFHKVIYDARKGTITFKGTHQGYKDWSTWTRGQAWAIYGFTMAHEHTGILSLKKTAQKAATFFLESLPADNVPLWDVSAPADQPWKDTSAGAIAAAGLLRLAAVTTNTNSARLLRSGANRLLRALLSGYLSTTQTSPPLASILRNATASAPAGRYATGAIYGDYYLLDALAIRQQQSSSR